MTEERVTSRQNPQLQHLTKLLTDRNDRYAAHMFAADGIKLLEEAARWASLELVVLADGVQSCPLPEGVRVLRVPAELMRRISPMQTPQGALFSCHMPPDAPAAPVPGCLVLDGIQDPGNLGTILRTADALEIPALLVEECADPYNPKTIRAAMGAIFRTPPRQSTRERVAADCRTAGIPLLAAALDETALDLREAPLPRAAVIIGSEGRGVSAELLARSDGRIIIPMNPRCESLNAAAAAAILLWQMKR